MIELLTQCDFDYGNRVANGIGLLMHDDGSLEIEMGAEMTPTYGKLPKEGGSPLGSNKAADAVEEANEKEKTPILINKNILQRQQDVLG